MKKISLILCAIIAVQSFGQRHLDFTLSEILHKEDVKASPVEFDNQYNGIIGNAFLADQWTSGKVFTMMKIYAIKKMKFDIYKNKIYINNNDTIFDITTTGIIQFEIFPDGDSTQKMSFNNGFNIEEITPEKFVQVLSEGKISFLKYFHRDIEEVYESSPSYKEKKFLDKNKYYIAEEGQGGKEVTVTKKNLEKILAPKFDMVSKYAKSNDISMSNETGWKKLIDYYNSLN